MSVFTIISEHTQASSIPDTSKFILHMPSEGALNPKVEAIIQPDSLFGQFGTNQQLAKLYYINM